MKWLAGFIGLITGASAEWRRLYEAQDAKVNALYAVVDRMQVEIRTLREECADCHLERDKLQGQVDQQQTVIDQLRRRVAELEK